jgi:hypothetical protein
MSRLTGSDALGLFEAYQAVYVPQEITEEQVWEEVEYWVNDLMREGYDLSDYTWEEMYEAYMNEERAPGVRPYKAGPTQAEVRADAKRSARKKAEKDKDKEGYGPEEKFKDWKLTSTPSTVNKKGETISQRMDKEAPYKTRPFSPLFTKQGSRTASAVTRATEGPGEPQSVTMPRKKSKPSKEIVRKRKDTNESYDLYDVILSHLLDEGYAETEKAAEAIMVNMSEDWIDGIYEMFGPSLGLNVAATRSQSQAKPTTKPPLADIRGGGGNIAKPTAKPPAFRPNFAAATSAFSKTMQ